MQIQVLENEKIVFDNDVKNDLVVLGRGSDCEIRCINEAISRKHLEIKNEDGKILIKNLSKNNWSMLNNEKIKTGEYVEYFAFYELHLPGNVEVKVILEDEDALKEISSTRYTEDDEIDTDNGDQSRKGPRKPYRPKLASAAKQKSAYKSKVEFSEILKMCLGLLLVGVFFVFQYKDKLFGKNLKSLVAKETNTQRTIELKKELWEAKKNRNKKAAPSVKKAIEEYKIVKEDQDPLTLDKCISSDEIELCNLILDDRSSKEGIAIQGENLFGFIGLSNRKYVKFSNEFKYPGLKGIPDKYLYRLLASYYFLDPKVFFKIKSLGIKKIFVYVIDDVPLVPTAKIVYKINFAKNINYSQVDFNIAIDGILQRAIPDYFNKYLARYLIKVQ